MLRKGKGTDRQDSMMIHYSTRSRWSRHLEFPSSWSHHASGTPRSDHYL